MAELIVELGKLDQGALVIYESDGTYDTEFLEADEPFEVKGRYDSATNCVLIGNSLWKPR